MNEFSRLSPIINIDMGFESNAGGIFYGYVLVNGLPFIFPMGSNSNEVMDEFILMVDIVCID
jgi:hypothetical protein